MAAYKAKLEWKQRVTGFPIAEKLRPALTTLDKDSLFKSEEDWRVYFDILDDFSYETKSNFENMGDSLSGLGSFVSSVINVINTFNNISGLSGKESPFAQFLKLQAWKDTEPFRMSFEFNLHTKTDPFIDVYAPAMAMLSMSILTGVNGIYYTPGINFKNLNSVKKLREEAAKPPETPKAKPTKGGSLDAKDKEEKASQDIIDQTASSSKLIRRFSIITSVIDGVSSPTVGGGDDANEIELFGINGCFVESCKPTWSKERTSSGIPLWCKLDMTIQSVFSASDSIFSIMKPLEKLDSQGATEVVATNIFR